MNVDSLNYAFRRATFSVISESFVWAIARYQKLSDEKQGLKYSPQLTIHQKDDLRQLFRNYY